MVNQTAKRDVTVSKDALLKSYSKRLKDDVRSLADNFSSIVKTCRYRAATGGCTNTPPLAKSQNTSSIPYPKKLKKPPISPKKH